MAQEYRFLTKSIKRETTSHVGLEIPVSLSDRDTADHNTDYTKLQKKNLGMILL